MCSNVGQQQQETNAATTHSEATGAGGWGSRVHVLCRAFAHDTDTRPRYHAHLTENV